MKYVKIRELKSPILAVDGIMLKNNWENKEYKYFSLNNLPRKIGFDHREIINDLKL